MNHRYIAFAGFKTDWPLVNELYPQAAGARVTLQSLRTSQNHGLPRARLWIDPEVDGLHAVEVFSATGAGYEKYRSYIEQFPNASQILTDRPDRTRIRAFVDAVLNSVIDATGGLSDVGYISVPQLPYVPGSERNRINRMLAELSLRWKSAQRRPPKFILPIIFAKKRGQTNLKTDRTPKVKLAAACFQASGADGAWVVDSTLDDHADVGNYENERFPGIVQFHEELNQELPPEAITIAGPYWGLNLILWARGLVRFPAIGLGRAYQYFVPGRDPQSRTAKTRIAVPPLKRLAIVSALKPWLQNSLRELPKSDPAHVEFENLNRNLDFLQAKERARRQIAQFYRDWLAKLESVPISSRALTLYQDLSAAFVLGSRLEPFDKNVEDVPNPAIIAKQLMVNCL